MKNTQIEKMVFGITAIALFALVVDCSVKAPEVKITGEKTALENQVIGTYNEIEQDSWSVASVRSTAPGQQTKMSDEKKKVLSAVQNRRFNKDDISEFKRDGIVGEGSSGFLVIRDRTRMNEDKAFRKRVEKIVAEENNDRQTILERAMEVNDKIANAGEVAVAQVFAQIYQDESEANTWIQQPDGSWIRKGAQ